MALRIRIEHGQDAGKTYRLATPGVYRVGRSPQGSFQVLDMKVSKEHFEIAHDPQRGTTIRDLASSHGTLLNGQKVGDARPLSPGDEVRLGLTVLRVLSDGAADAEAKALGPLAAAAPSVAGNGLSVAAPTPRPGSTGASSKATVDDPLVGTTLAGYRVLERVGAGGMGAVYRAEQLSLHREVALKVLAEKLVTDSAFVDQFVNEARAAGALNHPNVVQVYDVGQADGRHFFSMEFIHGGSLEDKIPRGKTVPWAEALPWFLDAANALIFAEKKGILHRDIKPDNLMLGQDGSVKLCDLGLAKKSESTDLLAQGIIGTPHFIAPEAIRRKTEVDHRADLYSLGCSMYRLLTGKNPFPGNSVKEILLAHLNQPPPRVSASGVEVAKELDDVVLKLMQKDPAARFQSATELWEALDKIRLQFGLAAHGLHPGRAKKMAILAGVVAAGAIVALVLLKPWENKVTIKTVTEKTEIRTGPDEKEISALRAQADFSSIESEAVKTLGRLEEGDNWTKEGWEEIAKRLDVVATDYPDTEAGAKARQRAADIRSYREQKKREAEALAAARADAQKRLKDAVDQAVAAARAKDKGALEASKVLAAADEAAKKIAAERPGLLTPEELAAAVKPLADESQNLAMKVRTDWLNADTAAKTKAAAGSGQALDEAIADYARWIEGHPTTADAGDVAREWNAATEAATKARGELVAQRDRTLRGEILVDRGSYFDWHAKEAYTPRNEDGSGGGAYARFQFGEAAERAAERKAKAKLPEYRELFAERERESTLLKALPTLLAANAKAFREKVSGVGENGWSGSVKEFTADALLTTDGKYHVYAAEGFGWFRDLFYDKGGQERFPLDADAHEALAVLMEASGILDPRPVVDEAAKGAPPPGTAARFDAANAEWDRAVALDAARKGRIEHRKDRAAQERAARLLLDRSDALRDEADKRIAELQKDITITTDLVKADAHRKVARGEIDGLREKLVEAHRVLEQVARGFATTIMRMLLEDAPPADAAYAGETLPPPEKPAPPPAPASGDKPPVPAPEPAMGETSPPSPAPEVQPPLPAAMDDAQPAMADHPAMDDTPGKPPSPPAPPPAMGEASPR